MGKLIIPQKVFPVIFEAFASFPFKQPILITYKEQIVACLRFE